MEAFRKEQQATTYAHDGRIIISYFKNLYYQIFKYVSKIMTIYSRRIVITLLSAASCFQFAIGIPISCAEHLTRRGRRQLSDIHTITTIDGCESTNYGIWLYAGQGHISLIGEPIMGNNEDATPSSNGENEDLKNGNRSDTNTKSCPTLLFDDGGESLDKAMIDVNLVLSQGDSSYGTQDPASTSRNENYVAAWRKEDSMRLHKTNYKNANKTISSFVLSEVTTAYHHAMRRIGDYDIFNNNCATFVLNMLAHLEIKVDDSIIKFAASELYKNHTVIEPVLQNQTFMEDLFLEFSDDGATTTSSREATTTGLLRRNKHHQAQTAGGVAVDSLKSTELFVAHYVKAWSANQRRMRKMMETRPPYMSSPNRRGGMRAPP